MAFPRPPVDVVKDFVENKLRSRGRVHPMEVVVEFRGTLDVGQAEQLFVAMGLVKEAGSPGYWEEPKTPQAMMYAQMSQVPTPSYITSIFKGQAQLQGMISTGTGVPGSQPTPPKKASSTKKEFKLEDVVEIIDNTDKDDPHEFAMGTIAKIISLDGRSTGRMQIRCVECEDTMWVQKQDIKLYNPDGKKRITLDSVVISGEKKEQIKSAISQVENSKQIFEEWGFADVFEKGTAISLLFWGIPGTGKTLMAQAIADMTDHDLKIYGTADIQSSEPGGAERMIRKIFEEAKKINTNKNRRNRLILFDECESLLTDRNEVGAILGAQVNALLTEIERYDGIIVFTTNRMGKLDPALERRITAKIEFTFPTQEERKAIWKRLIPKKAPIAKDVDFTKLSRFPLAGGNIKNVVLNTARLASYKKAKELTMAHFLESVKSEEKSLHAFMEEYKKQNHQSLRGHVTRDPQKGLVVDQKAVDEEINVSRTMSMKMKGKR